MSGAIFRCLIIFVLMVALSVPAVGDSCLQARIEVPDVIANNCMGTSVGISGDLLVAGAHNDDTYGYFSGAAYFFRRSGLDWAQETKVHASDADVDDGLGFSADIAGRFAGVSAFQHADAGSDSRQGYIYRRRAWACTAS